MSSKIPAVSVILPVHNAEKTVTLAVCSILKQTYSDFELIAVDDGSTDRSGTILEDLANSDDRIRIIRESRKGLVTTLNSAIGISRGEFIARMDADDISAPQRFEAQLKFLKNNIRLAGVSSFYREIDSSGRELWNCQMPVGPRVIRDHLQNHGNALVHPAILLRREAIQKCGGYRELFAHAEDYDLWLRILEHYDFDNVPEYLLDYRRSDSSISTRHREQQLLASIAARRSAFLRARGRPDPADTTNVISREVLHAWGVEDTEICRLMTEWLAWHRRMLEAVGAKPDPELTRLENEYERPAPSYIVNSSNDSASVAFSVGIIVLDHGRHLEKTLTSVLRSRQVQEIFIYAPTLDYNARQMLAKMTIENDGRISNTVGEYMKEWTLGRYLTAFVKESTTEYLSVLKSGDVAVAGRYAEAAKQLALPSCELVFGNCLTLEETPRKRVTLVEAYELSSQHDAMQKISARPHNSATLLMSTPALSAVSNLIFSKTLYHRLHGMADFTFVGDWDFALRAALLGAAEYCDRPFTVHTGGQEEYSRHESLINAAETRLVAARGLLECKELTSASNTVRERLRHLSGEAA